jgi:hypothetical protein
VHTYGNGELAISITSPLSPSTVINIDPNTSFSVEIARLSKKNSTTLDMFTGDIALKVQHLAGNQELDVRSEGSVMGVRGTSFDVGTSPGGDTLVTCDEGDVEVSADSGKTVHAVPGKAIEQEEGGELKEIPVAISSLRKFRENWFAEKVSAFKANAPRAIKNFAVRYAMLLKRFNKAYEDLLKHKAIIDKWIKENKSNKIGGKLELIREKKALVRDLLTIKRILFIFERVYFRVAELQSYFNEGTGKNAMISSSLSAKTFFADFEREKLVLAKKTALVKYVMKLFAKRNDGSFPTGEEDSITGDVSDTGMDDDFFDED